jgi:hypothetical protein
MRHHLSVVLPDPNDTIQTGSYSMNTDSYLRFSVPFLMRSSSSWAGVTSMARVLKGDLRTLKQTLKTDLIKSDELIHLPVFDS